MNRTESAAARLSAFSNRLRMLLAQRGHALAPQDLAENFTLRTMKAVSPQTFSNWINGVQLPGHQNLHALATYLSVTPEFLLKGTPVLQFAPVKHTDFDAAQIADDFMKLDAYGRKVARALMSSLAQLRGAA